jgi:phospholipase/carboxylesterase
VAGIRFIERASGGASLADRLPLVVAIHGMGDRADAFEHLFDGFTGRARFVFPYGLTPHNDGFSWFTIQRLDPVDPDVVAEGVERAAHKLAAMISELSARRPTTGRPIVTGFSQGGILSFTLAALHPEDVGEALPMAGFLPPRLRPSSWPMGKLAPRVVAFHGDADPIVRIEDARASVAALVTVGFSAELRPYPGVVHTVNEAMRRDVYEALTTALDRTRSGP